MNQRILVIKLGALGDFFTASAAFEAIRAHHKADHVTLLTTAPYQELAQTFGHFDDIWVDARPRLTRFRDLMQIRNKLISGAFDRVYDLQMVDRTNLYYHMMWPHQPKEWVGTTWGCSHRYRPPKLLPYHQTRLGDLLGGAGVGPLPALDIRPLAGEAFALPNPYVLLVPGSSKAHRDIKCWPLDRYGVVAQDLHQNGFTPVIVGGKDEDHSLIREYCPQAIDMTGQTSIMDAITLATYASFAIGNDTGLMHIAAASQCPVLTLFFTDKDPYSFGPRGRFFRHLHAQEKIQLTVDTVLNEVKKYFYS